MNTYQLWVSDKQRTVDSEKKIYVRATFGFEAIKFAERKGYHVMSLDVSDSIPSNATVFNSWEE